MKSIIILILFFYLFLCAQEERRLTHVTKGFMPFEQTKDYMLGNNDYGFFIQNLSDSKAICRLRIKIECDYGLGVVKSVKSSTVSIIFAKNEMGLRTDDAGLADGWFSCETDSAKKNIKISVKKFEAIYKAQNFPKTIAIPEKQCW